MRNMFILNLNISERQILLLVHVLCEGSLMGTGRKAERKEDKVHLLTSQGLWPSLFLQLLSISGCEQRTLTTSGHPNLQAKWRGVSKPCKYKQISNSC